MKAPARLPRPPTTTTTKLSMITSELIEGDSDRKGAATTPASPASAVPRPTTRADSASVCTPCIAVVTGSVEAARTNRPMREWRNHSVSPSATAAPTTITPMR